MASLQEAFDSFKSLFTGNRPKDYTSLADTVFRGGGHSISDSASGYFRRIFDPTGVSMDFNSAEALKNREFQAQQAEIQRTYNSAEAQKNRDFQERMSNTSYQRARDDMLKAGLNPYLMYGSGGASSPSGSVASASSLSGSQASASSGQNLLLGLVHTAIDLGFALRL
ncbi:DNA pilot protein [Peromfec virus RodF8_56]|uniref:DNA pilot protein n=1 Tax=Peromfec virus RodF8_56 TaxID=2929384 RepID=A0A976N2A5_9VIRU|nr:DNA pilot protein [Peromfec virus RodF8_56]